MSQRIERSALVNYRPEQMFDLVNDIERYPEFMDGCVEAQVLQRGHGWLEARLTLSKLGVRHSFVTRNQLQRPERMTISLVDGPFSRLEGSWQFIPLGDKACKVLFKLEFTLRNRLLGAALGKLMESVASAQVDSVCRRAGTLYNTGR